MLVPSSAMAGKAQGGGKVNFSAASKENNQVMIESGATLASGESSMTVTELAGVPLTFSTSKCTKAADLPHPKVSCSAKQPQAVVNVRDGNDTALGSGSASFTMNGAAGNDRLIGGSGDDKLNGGTGDDSLLSGGAGSDTIRGGTGNDQIDAADGGTNDNVNCGAGNDLVATDLDKDGKPIADKIAKNCEQIVPPQEDFSCTGPECVFGEDYNLLPEEYSDGPLMESDCAAVSTIGRSAKIKKRATKLKLTAPKATAGNCSGKLTMVARLRKRGKKVKKVKLGSAKFSVAPGKSATVKVKLTKRGAKLIKKYKKIRTLVTVRTNQDVSGGAVISSRSMTLKLKKAKRARKR